MNKALFLLVPLVFTLPGCIAWEIRDEMRTANRQLAAINPTMELTAELVYDTDTGLARTQVQLAELQSSLAATQQQLDALHASLKKTDEDLVTVTGKLEQTNPSLTDLQGGLERMRILNEIQTSIQDVNKALVPLSASLGTLGGAVSFLGLSSDSSTNLLDKEHAAETTAATPSAGAAPAPEPNAADPNAPKRPDPILGTWVMVYPPPSPPQTMGKIFVITGDGKFLSTEDGKPITSGTWVRQGRSLSFTPDATTPPSSAETVELLTLNSRTLTVRRDQVIRVYARP